jgi:hypothetical protein
MPAFHIYNGATKERMADNPERNREGHGSPRCAHPGMIADDLSDYFFARTSGYIGSMMELARIGMYKAIKSGVERISKELLDTVQISRAAEKRRTELDAAMHERQAP